MIIITVMVNGQHQTIINKVLRVPYFSNIEILCKGPEKLAWQYRNTLLPPSTMPSVNHYLGFHRDKEQNAIITISNFNHDQMGFYSCSSLNPKNSKEETLLVISGKCGFSLSP